jgi:hypothetical protein
MRHMASPGGTEVTSRFWSTCGCRADVATRSSEAHLRTRPGSGFVPEIYPHYRSVRRMLPIRSCRRRGPPVTNALREIAALRQQVRDARSVRSHRMFRVKTCLDALSKLRAVQGDKEHLSRREKHYKNDLLDGGSLNRVVQIDTLVRRCEPYCETRQGAVARAKFARRFAQRRCVIHRIIESCDRSAAPVRNSHRLARRAPLPQEGLPNVHRTETLVHMVEKLQKIGACSPIARETS